MEQTRKSRNIGFLDGYRLADTYLLKPDKATGRPGIIEGTDPDGEPVLVKNWPRNVKQPDDDLEEIWRHELRQLHRLYGYPGASDLIAPLRATGLDDRGFYIVLEPGIRRPLEMLLRHASANNWLKQPRQARNRVRIWANIRRIVLALETLHLQGLLHRNLDSWAILTAANEEPDFQLTGFEWSMRLSAVDDAKDKRGKMRPAFDRYDSFRQDWASLGWLAADLLGASRDKVAQLALAPSSVADHLSATEVRVLRQLISAQPLLRLDGEVIALAIDEVISGLTSEIAGHDAKHYLVARVGTGSRLAEDIHRVTDGDIETDDTKRQLRFISDDLSESPQLMAVKLGPPQQGFRLVLRGHHLIYRLGEYRHPRQQTSASWEFASIEGTDIQPPVASNVIGQFPLDANSLEVMSTGVATESYPRLRGKLNSWEEIRRKFETEETVMTPEARFRRALSLSQLLEMAFAVYDTFPVQILPAKEPTTDDGSVLLRVMLKPDPDRAKLSKPLGLRPMPVRFDQMLTTDDNVREDAAWTLTDIRQMGERGLSDTEWRFQEVESTGGEPVYVFSGTGPVPVTEDASLIPSGSIGQNVQFRRRLKALKALSEHVELLRMLVAPRRRLFDSHDQLQDDKEFRDLDEPKQLALREAVSTMPIYLVQGPPGVGKTRLVRELVRRRFSEEPTTRILLTAQSNAAIDHLMSELEETLKASDGEGPLVVRCRSKDKPEARSSFEISNQLEKWLQKLVSSDLMTEASPGLQSKLTAMAGGGAGKGRSPRGLHRQSPEYARRAFEGLLMRAANVVFATTNSAEIERLIDERGQFDWSIVEEAGKATGGELLSPLLLSHRRMMIGDHKQLPPYRSEEMKRLLEKPDDVREVVRIAGDLIARSLRDSDMEELLDEIEEEDADLAPLCADAINTMMLFETLVEAEFKRQSIKKQGRPIARRLSKQHRMHPAIARIVSRAFYQRDLLTDEKREKEFAEQQPPFTCLDHKRLPTTPVVVVDMPYIQAHVGQKDGDQPPPWRNPSEAQSVIQVLSLLQAAPGGKKRPTLAVLSPYARQVRLLDKEIEAARSGSLSVLSGFDPATKSGSYCSTVDSFQGSEADIVVVSLVRNNQFTAPEKSLGFLRDSRRMNVLLSRARWKMVLVGSIEFIKAVSAAMKGEDAERYAFLPELLAAIDDGRRSGEIAFVSPAQLGGGK
ncbi:AAA domain-containing protein [Neorhizobium petrolearium]|uniref:AAA domain-containing protein n=1 Tax=Neorhizobium petrolearium TaxID=515361 RepID=UPI003F1507B2